MFVSPLLACLFFAGLKQICSINQVVSAPKIVSLVAQNPTNVGSVYGNGDTITVSFDVATDQAGLTANVQQSRVIVDSLFRFSQSLGTDYVGSWRNSRTFVVTIIDWPGAAPPTVGPGGLIVSCRTDAGRSIRADPFTVGLSVASTSVSTALTGDFGVQDVKLSVVTALNPSGIGDVFAAGHRLILLFNIFTNQGYTTINGDFTLSKQQIDNMFSFSHSIGTAYSGKWDSLQQLTITIQDPTNSGPPPVGIFVVSCKVSGELRNTPPASAPCTTSSPPLTGNWGPSNLTIISLTAADPFNINTVYSVNDTLTVQFNKDTNLAGFQLNFILTKLDVDSVFTFSTSLGSGYTGLWVTRSTFVITVADITGAGPPSIGSLTVTVKTSAALRNYPPQSAPSAAVSPSLQGNWGTITPRIVAFVASGLNGAFSIGSTLTITFRPPTNLANLPQTGVSRIQIDSILRFSQNLGNDYSGVWIDNTMFRITVLDAFGAAPPVRGVLNVTCIPSGQFPIRNADQISDGCFSTSPPLSGDFGQSNIEVALTASGDNNPRYSEGDSIVVKFSGDTNRANLALDINKTQIDFLLLFSQILGSGYRGRWISFRELVINITNTSGSTPPTIGTLISTVKTDALLRNMPPNSAPISATSSVLTGNFGPNNVSISSLVASDPLNADSVFAAGDKISIIFSESTNQGGLGSTQISKQQIDSFITFSTSFGANYFGLWRSNNVLEITAVSTAGAGQIVLGAFYLTVNVSGNIRNFPPTSSPLNAISPLLSGDFGPSPITIVSFVAQDPSDLNNVYSVGDQITITFSQSTNQAGLPSALNKGQIDSLLNFSQALGALYVGNWSSPSQLVITVLDVRGAAPPNIAQTTVTVLQSAGLRNVPPQCKGTSVTSTPLSGNWGILFPRIVAVVAQDPTNRNSVYSFLDTITIYFSIPTNRAGRQIGDSVSRTDLLQLFTFSQQLGNAFSGEWVASDRLVITVEGTSGASPPTIGGLIVTCRSSAPVQIKNEVSTSRPCTSVSPRLSGDFGPSSTVITSLVASDPSNVGGRYRIGDTITVNFNENTNQGELPSATEVGGVLNKSVVDQIFMFSAPVGRVYTGSWTTRRQFVIQVTDITSAGPPIPGVFFVRVLSGGNIRNFPPASAPSQVTSPFLSGDFGPSHISIISWRASYRPSLTSCQGYVSGSMMTVTFSENTTRAGFSAAVTKAQLDSLFNFFFIIGTDYSGLWINDATLVITISDPFGSSPPTVGSVVGSVKASAGLRGLPPLTAGSFATAPVMTGAFGPSNVHFVSVVASGTDSVFSNNSLINVYFTISTNKAFLPESGISKLQLNKLFSFSMNLGMLYSAAWKSDSHLQISVSNASRDASNSLFYPPFVSTFRKPLSGLRITTKSEGELRDSPPLCAASSEQSPFMTGDFGPSKLRITGLEASTTVADSVYGKDDTITIFFSEDTDQAGYSSSSILSKSEILSIFNFSMSLGATFIGSWILPSMFTITCQDAIGSSPPTIGGLQVRTLAGNNIRNAPPQSAAMLQMFSPFLTGSFGPSDISIVAFNAYDPIDLSATYHAGNSMAIILSSHPSWKKKRIYNGQLISQAEIDTMLVFSQSIGRSYQGMWIDLNTCPADIYTNQPPFDGPPCVGIVVTVTDVTNAFPPQIGVLQVRFLEAGDVRNDPPQSDPTSARSQPITGTWGIPTPKIRSFTAAAPVSSLAQKYDDGVVFTLVFSEPTNRAGLGTAYFSRVDVDRLLVFSQILGTDYRGRWTSTTTLIIEIIDSVGSTPPEIGILTVAVLSGSGRILRNGAQTSKPSISRYTTDSNGVYGVQGSFSIPVITIESLTAERSTSFSDFVWGPGDTITVTFNVVVNKGCYLGCDDDNLSMTYLAGLFSFRDLFWAPSIPSLGASFSGAWSSSYSEPCVRCTRGTGGVCRKNLNPSNDIQAQLGNSSCSPLAVNSTVCPTGYSLCNSKILKIKNLANYTSFRPPTIGGFYIVLNSGRNYTLSNYPASSGPLTNPSPALTGDFGKPCVEINAIVASDPVGLDGSYGPGTEIITVEFNQNVSAAAISAGSVSPILNASDLDNLFTFFCLPNVECRQFAQSYVGKWTRLNQLTITFEVSSDANLSNSDPTMTPWIKTFYMQVKNGTNLRNLPSACEASTPLSPVLTGSFGPSNLAIIRLEIRDPTDMDRVYGNGDSISVTFSQDTDAAGMLEYTFTKNMVDNLFSFSRPIGLNYQGLWISRRIFMITVTDIGTVTPIDGINCCNGIFQVRVLEGGNLRQYPPTSAPTATCGGPQACKQVGEPQSKFWGSCSSLGQNLSNVCEKLEGNYGRPYPRISSLVGQGPGDGATHYRSGVNMTLSFSEPVNLGACNSNDAQDNLCNTSIGTCSLRLSEGNLSSKNCTSFLGIWISGSGSIKSNCQLMSVNTSMDCSKLGGQWSTGLSPAQGCSDGSNSSIVECLRGAQTWSIYETRIPKLILDKAMIFSDYLGTDYVGKWTNINLTCVLNRTLIPCSQTLVLEIINSSHAGPPEMDLFYITLIASNGIAIRSAVIESPGSIARSPPLTGFFGPFEVKIVSLAAGPTSNPGPVSGLYENGVTLTIGFNTYTNRANLKYFGVTKEMVNSLLSFDRNIGSNFSGVWTNCTLAPGKVLRGCQTFVINVSNTSGASPPTVGGLIAYLNSSSNLRNYPASSAPGFGPSNVISGDWGPSPIKIALLLAQNINKSFSGVYPGSSIAIFFNLDTNRGNMPLLTTMGMLEVNKIFKFIPESFARNYTGFWANNRSFVINITRVNSTFLGPYIDSFYAVMLPAAEIRNYPPTCAPSTGMSPALSGGFGQSLLFIVSVIANGYGINDTTFSNNDTISITFNQATNQGVFSSKLFTKAQIDSVFNFSMPIGTQYVGAWTDNRTFKITILNSTQEATNFWCESKPECSDILICSQCSLSTSYVNCVKKMPDSTLPDLILNINTPDCSDCLHPLVLNNETFISNNGTSDCRVCVRPLFNWQVRGICRFRNNGGLSPPVIGELSVSVLVSAGLREFPPVTEATDGTDPSGKFPRVLLSGEFCPSPVMINSVRASDTKLYDSVFGNGDHITITFNQATNKADLPQIGITKNQIDNLLNFSCSLGSNYSAKWLDSATLQIEMIDTAGNGLPRIGQFFVTTLARGNLRNLPPVCGQTVVSGNKSNQRVLLSNHFGPSSIYIKRFIAMATDDNSEIYRKGVIFSIQFSESTNRGNLPQTNISKPQIDNLLGFNSNRFPHYHPLGQGYSGSWSSDNQTLLIRLLEINITQLSEFGPPAPAGMGFFFRVAVKESGDLRNAAYQCSPTVIDDSVQALTMYGGIGAQGLDCDCCRQCGSCNVCSITRCNSMLGSSGILVDSCGSCCTGQRICCRVLKGNYGIVVAVTNLSPRMLPTAGALLTVSGKGFDTLAANNQVRVGGLTCPLTGISVDASTKIGNMTCLSPAGVGPDLKPVEVSVVDEVSGRQVTASCCSKLVGTVYVFSPGGISFQPPAVSAVVPGSIMYSQNQKLTIFGTNFGGTALFNQNKYIGPLGSIPRTQYVKPVALLVMQGGSYIPCLKTEHISDSSVVCITPEMTASGASAVVNSIGSVSRPWVPGSIIEILNLPLYIYACTAEMTGRCYDCCEAECQIQYENHNLELETDLDVENSNICPKRCFEFCGFSPTS